MRAENKRGGIMLIAVKILVGLIILNSIMFVWRLIWLSKNKDKEDETNQLMRLGCAMNINCILFLSVVIGILYWIGV